MAKRQKATWWGGMRDALFGGGKRRGGGAAKPTSLRFEPLEDRTVLSILTYVPGGADQLASDPVNWVNSSGQHVAPVAGDSLVFSGAAQTVLQNDLPAGTHSVGSRSTPAPAAALRSPGTASPCPTAAPDSGIGRGDDLC